MGVGVAVSVMVGVSVAVGMGVLDEVGVKVGVPVAVGSGLLVAVEVGDRVGADVAVDERVGEGWGVSDAAKVAVALDAWETAQPLMKIPRDNRVIGPRMVLNHLVIELRDMTRIAFPPGEAI